MSAIPPERWLRRAADALLGRGVTLALAVAALAAGLATFVLLSGGSPLGPTSPGQVVAMVLANAALLLLLGASLAGRLVRVWAERRRGGAGSRLHVRLVLLFGGVAVVPALLVAGFAAVFFNLGIQAWFSDRVRETLEASLIASRAYLAEHVNTVRGDAQGMANDLNRAAQVYLPDQEINYARVVATQAALRGLTEAVVFDPALGRVIATAGLGTNLLLDPPDQEALDLARSGEIAVLPDEGAGRVRALVALELPGGAMLQIGRPVDPGVLEHMRRTELSFAQYDQLDRRRGPLQITFALIFAVTALLVLFGAVLVGLVIANQIARPIARLILAADRVRGGDLSVRVAEGTADDEVASLSRAFNRMTGQLAAQRGELMEAYSQLDGRRRFTESVLAGVSAGVVGLDAEARINLPNRSASDLLGRDLDDAYGRPLADVVPEFGPLLAQAAADPFRPRTAEIPIGPAARRRTLLVRIGAEIQGRRVAGYVLTFDDITELQSAQRTAAWADVARRIAHEIKNPLTPISLSAERLRRRYLKQIQDDPETFRQLTDTIVRQVEDIGRMVDEFSAFARMPQPQIGPEDFAAIARDSLVLQRGAHPGIRYTLTLPEAPAIGRCDRRLIAQALTNLLQNAADAVAMREGAGEIGLRLETSPAAWAFVIEDDGIGLPDGENSDRLTEPYVTHKVKGTGLGLAIVKKIMEDHGGRVTLEARAPAPGTRASLIFLAPPTSGPDLAGLETETARHGA
ncbi:two-component system nitrogen regulation sensor histidine kinase NtrY [Humitalea rosea]|uniref:histidine kinase n=1 Tax=Humitalea rosea TaxID=990373 RepID=A0A2W7ITD7_9PROT|nr:PAS domain-containing sensor histidine kinase [Humitalea rosea]PZW51061.1 two-component system nitrogen regulation sensor histidine kinase NtrY [Humitalea rosea]